MEFGSSILSDLWIVETTPDETAFAAKLAIVKEKFERVEAQLGEGPFFSGAAFSLVDAVFAPVFRYFDVLDEIADLGVFSQTPKVRAWRKALAARASVREVVAPDYADRLRAFLLKHNGVVAGRMAQAA
jgi:glutathione S-transferase